MLKFRTAYILALFVFGLALGGCSATTGNNAASNASNTNASADNSNIAKDNIEELGLLVRLPVEPEDVIWKETVNVGNESAAKRLIAVLRFTDENANKLAAMAAVHRPPEPHKLAAESWFPAELISQSEISGEANLEGLSYAANDLAMPPNYSAGTLTRIKESGFFVLEMIGQ